MIYYSIYNLLYALNLVLLLTSLNALSIIFVVLTFTLIPPSKVIE